jgi:uncharacterized membrane protein
MLALKLKLKEKINLSNILVLVLFIVFTLIYFKNVIYSPSDSVLTNFMAEDQYWHFMHVIERIDLLKKFFFPFGDYWVARGGGFPAGGIEIEHFLSIGEDMLAPFYLLTGNIFLAHKIAHMSFYLLALIFSYWYGITIFKRKDAGIILAIAYAFNQSTFTWEKNIHLAATLFLVPITLTFTEKVCV